MHHCNACKKHKKTAFFIYSLFINSVNTLVIWYNFEQRCEANIMCCSLPVCCCLTSHV